MQGLGKPLFGDGKIDKASHPCRQCLEWWEAGAKCICLVCTGVHFLTEHGRDQVGPVRVMSIERADTHTRPLRDVAHRRIDAGNGKHVLCRPEDREQVTLRIRTHALSGRNLLFDRCFPGALRVCHHNPIEIRNTFRI